MKNTMKSLFWVFVLFCFFGMSSAFAEPSCMRCEEGNKMVCIGSPASTVLAKCGSPLAVNEIGTKTKTNSRGTVYSRRVSKGANSVYSTRHRGTSTSMKLEEWTYCIRGSYGNDCYIYILKFNGDKLTKITSTQEQGN
jgi:hypothetical protein